MDNINKDNNTDHNHISFFFSLLIIGGSMILASLILKRYKTLTPEEKSKIAKFVIVFYIICTLGGILGVIFSAIE